MMGATKVRMIILTRGPTGIDPERDTPENKRHPSRLYYHINQYLHFSVLRRPLLHATYTREKKQNWPHSTENTCRSVGMFYYLGWRSSSSNQSRRYNPRAPANLVVQGTEQDSLFIQRKARADTIDITFVRPAESATKEASVPR